MLSKIDAKGKSYVFLIRFNMLTNFSCSQWPNFVNNGKVLGGDIPPLQSVSIETGPESLRKTLSCFYPTR
jgi:hypothetical protein